MENQQQQPTIMNDDDFVFNKSSDGKISSAGFTIDSILMQKGQPALLTRNGGHIQTGGNVSDLFKDLAVPAGLVSFTPKQIGGNLHTNIVNNDVVIPEDIHEKLLKMVEVDGKRNKKTRRTNVTSSKTKGTKKQRV
jgi:hypothetical protein